MAVCKKGSRNISVDNHDFKWHAIGNDGWVSIVLWSVNNKDSRVVASIDYHHDMKQVGEGHISSLSQLIVTNRIIREIILHIGIEKILGNHGQLNIGRVEEFYDISNALRS